MRGLGHARRRASRPRGALGAGMLALALVFALAGGALTARAGEPSHALAGPSPKTAIAEGILRDAVHRYGHRAALERGMVLVLGERCTAAKCFACVTCHGLRGQGSASSGVPRLTGQSYRYLYYSLRNFASGQRRNGTMQSVARRLTDRQMRDVADWYAAQRLRNPVTAGLRAHMPHPKHSLLVEGGTLSAFGSARDAVQGCENCHGPAGIGEPPVYPYLAGQYASYLQAQLEDFKSGKRRGDPLHIMSDLAARLSGKQIYAVAEYFGSMQPPIYLPDRQIRGRLRIGAPLGPAPPARKPPAPHVTAAPAPSPSSGVRP